MPRSCSRPVLLSVLVGLISGGRSAAGINALAWSIPSKPKAAADRLLAHPKAKAVLGAGAAGELVADKLPFTPSRLGFPQVLGRLGAGAFCGVIIAQRHRSSIVPSAIFGAVSAYAGSWLGTQWRKRASDRFDGDTTGALIEDALVISGAVAVAVTTRR